MSLLRQFQKNYKANFMYAASADDLVGQKVEFTNLTKTKYEITRVFLPEFIANTQGVSFPAELISNFKSNSVVELSDANLAPIEFDGSQEKALGLDFLKSAFKLTGSIDTSKIYNFKFDDIKSRALTGDTLSLFIRELSKIKNSDKKTWRKINQLNLITSMFYAGKIYMEFDSSHKAQIDATFKGVPVNVTSSGNGKTSISFDGNLSVPIAFTPDKVADILR